MAATKGCSPVELHDITRKINRIHEHISRRVKPELYKTIDASIDIIASTARGESKLYDDITDSTRYHSLIKEINKFYDYVERKYKSHIISNSKKEQK